MPAYQPHYGYRPVPMTYPGLLTLFGSSIALASATLWGGARVVKHVVEGSLWESGRPWHDHHGCCCVHYYRVECRPPCAGSAPCCCCR
jgi:hypothetical protein